MLSLSLTKEPETDPDCVEVLEDSSRSILMGIINQLRRDMDIQRISLPAFILEPRSMLEKVTDFLSHPDFLIEASIQPDPEARFVGIVKYFLSGWHIKPKGVKKPYNPVLGEVFRCRYEYKNGTEGFFVSEQVSHHPPISAFYYGSPENGVYVQGDLHLKSRFLGNSAATLMEGENHIIFTRHNNELYDITMPNVYVRGILFGKMALELGGHCVVRCKTSDLICELDFKTKGFFSGQYDLVSGVIKRESTGEILYEISGQWSNEIYIKKVEATNQTVLFDVKASSIHPKIVASVEKQEPKESRRLWYNVTNAILKDDMDTATDEKTIVEEKQREEARYRKAEKKEFHPTFFNQIQGDRYRFKGSSILDYNNKEQAKLDLKKMVFAPLGSDIKNAPI
ncbi:Oxysterol-binding C23B6.01c [Choanephora cucurbitarum]|uniref:Oxysterol-binding C23B6.01c n=1 Tax=Choanephora cucurbitarum TaxID=101091 RepID=A0A1C7N7Q9_9FUNG|nr:Oxysterol-binding C23B6.01c [Choanephora cucurbitarum]